jgi:hypothetical protein
VPCSIRKNENESTAQAVKATPPPQKHSAGSDKVKVTSLYMPQRASQRKLGKKPVTKPI